MTLKVKYSEAKVKEGQSPLFKASLAEGYAGTRYITVAWSDALTALAQAVGYSFAALVAGAVPGFDDPGGQRRVLRRELPEIYPGMPRCICIDADIVQGRHWLGRVAYKQDEFTQLLRQNPEVLPGFPNNTYQEGGDTLWKENVYREALIRLSYKQVRYDVLSDAEIDRPPFNGNEYHRFLEKRVDRQARYLTLPGGTMYWVLPRIDKPGQADDEVIRPGDDEPTKTKKNQAYNTRRTIPQGVGIIECDETVYFKQMQISEDAIPYKTLRDGTGKVNKLKFREYDPGTLLYMPFKEEPRAMPGGTLQQVGMDLEHVMIYNRRGHNKLLRYIKGVDESKKYYYVTADSAIDTAPDELNLQDGKFIYDAVDFNQFFIPSNP